MRFKLFFLFVSIFLISHNTDAQKIWETIEVNTYQTKNTTLLESNIIGIDFRLVHLDFTTLQKKSVQKTKSRIIELPNLKKGFSKYELTETSSLNSALAKKYPMIKSYTATSIENKGVYAKVSMGLDGFHAVVYTPGKASYYIDPYSKDQKDYVVYDKSMVKKKEASCLVENLENSEDLFKKEFKKISNDGVFRTYRLALACTGEYAEFHLNRQGIENTASEEVKKAAVLSAMNTSITRVNGVLEKELSLKLEIVANNDQIVFLNKDTDGFNTNDDGILIDQNQRVIDREIGDLNYDIGHIVNMTTGRDSGAAEFQSVCRSSSKARAVTGRSLPIGDFFDIDFFIHEIGHQFGATHTYNNSCDNQRFNATAIEPGSGSTIMGYAGICFPNVQNNSDDYFHSVSIDQINNFIILSGGCAAERDLNNTPPIANAGLNHTIPRSTPFVLRGAGTDVENQETLTFNWEQVDREIAIMAPLPTNRVGPMFRSLPATTSPNRYFPTLETVVAGETATEWEVLPSVARNMSFSLLVRDNNPSGGASGRDGVTVSVVDADPFVVTVPNTSVIWDVGSSQTIRWNKGTTDIAPINCTNVNIKLSVDGGVTFPITIKENTPNDGEEVIVIPNNVSTQARIMVEAVDNIFYNVNASNFTINSTVPTFILTSANETQFACNEGNQSGEFTLNLDFVNGFAEDVVLSVSGNPTGSLVSFSRNNINSDEAVLMTVSNLNNVLSTSYPLQITAASSTVVKNLEVTLNVTNPTFNELILTSPSNQTSAFSIKDNLTWQLDNNAASYRVELSRDIDFSEVIVNEVVTTNAFSILSLEGNKTYYWRVKPTNSCGEGAFSDVFSFTTIAPYCISNFNDEAGGSEHITNITFNTINNDSGNDTTDGYEDFTAFNTCVKRGDTHTISVTADADGFNDHIYVFIDWNRDLIFDKITERFDLGNITGNTSTTNFDITVPVDAVFGSTRMRIVLEYFDNNNPNGDGACDTDHLSEWGETEDYTIIVGDKTAGLINTETADLTMYPNPTDGEIILNLNNTNNNDVSVELFDLRGRLVDKRSFTKTGASFTRNIIFNEVQPGLYFLQIINGEIRTRRRLIFK